MQSLLSVAPLESAGEVLFRLAYNENFRPLHRYVTRLSGDTIHAEDLAQEAFARLWKEILSRGEPPNVRAWLFRVASNLIFSRFRSRVRALRFLLPMADSGQRAADGNVEHDLAQRQIVERVLQQLPAPMRQCLLLHHEGLTAVEIGEVLRIKPAYVRTLVFRSHERFRRGCDALGGRP